MAQEFIGIKRRVPYEGVIERVVIHNSDTRSLLIRIPGASEFSFAPGQFISVIIPAGDKPITRSYSLASSPEDGQPFEICLNLIDGGVGSNYLFSLKEGSTLSFTGPFGVFTLNEPPQVETVFIAEGTAIAPIRPMLRRAISTPDHPPLSLIYTAPDGEHLLYRSEFEALAQRDPRFRFEPIITATGRLSALLDDLERRYVKGDALRERHFYICGVGNDVLKLRDLLRGAGYPRRWVEYERW